MNLFAILLTVTLSLALGMCSGSKKNQLDAQDEAVADSAMPTPPLPPPPPGPIAPGSAKITAEVLRFDSTDGGYISTIRVIEVHGYGSATPPLAPESELEVQFHNAVLSGADMTPEDNRLAPGSRVTLTIKHRELSKLMGNPSPSWQALTIQ